MSGLNYAQLIIYATLSIPVIYLAYKHGIRVIIGWTYLVVFCSLRVVGSAMEISSVKNHSSNSTASLISSIGLSPLLLASVGILHEARKYKNPGASNFWQWVRTIALHLLASQGLGMIAGASSAFGGSKATSTQLFLIKFGIATLEVVWLLVFAWALLSLGRVQRATESPGHRLGSKLLYSVLFAMPFIGIRVTYSLVLIFTNLRKLMDTPMGMKIGLSFIPELIAVLGFVGAGFVTRTIEDTKKEERSWRTRHGDGDNVRLETRGGNSRVGMKH